MNAESVLDGLVEELLAVLEADIVQVSLATERLDALRGAVIRRDEEGLRGLLEKVQCEGEKYRGVEARRQDLRGKLAKIAGCSCEEMNLSALCRMLSGEKRVTVAAKQERLRQLTEKLRREHLATTLLLRECSRLNKKG